MSAFVTLLINLDASSDRLRAAETVMAVQGAAFERVPGVDGRQTPVDTVEAYDDAAARRYFGRTLSPGEVGAFQSHVRALETFLAGGAAFGLILEDDMDPDAHAMAFVGEIVSWQNSRWQQDWYVANLGAKRQKITTPLIDFEGGDSTVTLARAHYFPMLATANLWTRDGARAFLDQHQMIDCPWDHALRRWLTANDMGLLVSPLLFSTSRAESTIDSSAPEGRRGAEERDRFYRLRRMRRNWGDRLRALVHKTRNGPRYKRQ
ncbi:MAG: glycosyltransferase family 25 protein [Pseudomonadota bacterium]